MAVFEQNALETGLLIDSSIPVIVSGSLSLLAVLMSSQLKRQGEGQIGILSYADRTILQPIMINLWPISIDLP